MRTILIIIGIAFLLGLILWIIDIIKGICAKVNLYRTYPHLKDLPDYFPYNNNEIKCGIIHIEEGFDELSDNEKIEYMDKELKEGSIMVTHNKLYINGKIWAEKIRFKKSSDDVYGSMCDGEWCLIFSCNSAILSYPFVPRGESLFIMMDYGEYKKGADLRELYRINMEYKDNIKLD